MSLPGRALALLFASILLVPAVGSSAFAADTLECTAEKPCILRVRTVAPAASPWGSLLKKLAADVKKASDGRIKTKVYWQSKSEPSAVRQCLSGKVGGIAVSNGALSSAVPELMSTEMPYLFDDYGQVDKAFAAAEPMIKKVLDKAGFVYALRGENGFRHFASTSTFFLRPEDLEGKSMRSQPAKHHIDMYKELKATPNPINVAEVPTSLANGTVSGYDNTLLFADLANWADPEVIKYVTLSGHIYQGATVAWCGAWYDRLPADLQQVLTTSRPKLAKLGLRLVRVFNDKKMPEKYKSAGVQLKELTTAQKDGFRKRTQAVVDTFKANTTDDGRALLKTLMDNR